MANAEKITGSTVTHSVEFADLLCRIHSQNSPAYSKNLHQWMKSHGRTGDVVYQSTAGSKLARVYGAGAFFIGQPYSDYESDTDFSGALLMQVLCMGRSVVRSCYGDGAPGLIEVAGFWGSYEQIGRCAIDPQHKVLFRDNEHRFHHVDGQTVCNWCSTHVVNGEDHA